jgi:predicted nucleic acid-binding protein
MIIDASVAVKWLIDEEGSDVARALLGRVDLVAPTLIHIEVGNAVWKKRRRGEFIDDPDLTALPELLASVLLTIDETPMMKRALSIALELDHPIYDCVYLAVAEALDQELVTADAKFCKTLSNYAGRSRVRPLVP